MIMKLMLFQRLVPAIAVWLATLCLSVAQDVVLVKGTVSTPNTSERNYAASIASRLGRWLEDINIPYRTITDEDVAAGGLRSAKTAILSYNPCPTRKEKEQIKSFLEGGGKLIVFFSSDSELASLMRMKLGAYKPAAFARQWTSYTFNRSAPAMVPETIYQDSRCLRPVFPANNKAVTIARWRSDNSDKPSDPAWVRSDRGMWMSHVLLEGDSENKKKLLLAMLGACDPTIWKKAATSAVARPGRVGSFSDFDSCVTSIRKMAARSSGKREIARLLESAAAIHAELPRLFQKKKYAETVEKERELRRTLSYALSTAQPSRINEIRAVWEHTGLGLHPGNWEATCRTLAQHGFNVVFPNVMRPGQGHYRSVVVPRSEQYHVYGDQIGQCLRAARKEGIDVHIWKLCWNLDGAPESLIRRFRKEKRLQVTDTGKTINWLCPSDPRNLAYELDAIKEVVRMYPIEGIHLDYIRYPDSRSCYCTGCRERFEQKTGKRISKWPRDVRQGSKAKLFNIWRCRQITALVSSARKAIDTIRPGTKLSAAVFGKYPSCREAVAQDWPIWLQRGYVDFVMPMNYFSDNKRFMQMTLSQMKLPAVANAIVPGIGVTSKDCRLDAAQTVEQIRILRDLNARGFVLFDLNTTLEKEILPVLGAGTTAPR